MAEGPYTRLYHQIIDEFPEIYSNDATFALAVRLLVSADKVWPESADLPRSTRRRPLAILVAAGLILPEPGDRFRFLGMDKERAGRSEKAKAAADARWKRSHPPGNARSNAPGNAPSNAKSMPNPNPKPSPIPSPTLPSVGDALSPAPAHARGEVGNGGYPEEWAWLMGLAEEVTGTPYALKQPFDGHGATALDWVRKVGKREVERVFQEVAKRHLPGKPTIKQLMFEADDVLFPILRVPMKRLTPEEEIDQRNAARLAEARARKQQQEAQG